MEEIEQRQQENAALIQALYAAFEQRDIAGIVELLADDIDWLFFGPSEIPFAGHYRGHAEVAGFFEKALGTSDFLVFEPREVIPGFTNVLVQGFERVRARSTDRIWETDWAHVFTIADGKIVKLREYYDTAVMVEAFRSE
ncbi:MAG TPA: nuclear transport factor 2 family protein [Abditibacteriaceae bacterium]|jgi:hypothetical protein